MDWIEAIYAIIPAESTYCGGLVWLGLIFSG